jgi:hypothetical protein
VVDVDDIVDEVELVLELVDKVDAVDELDELLVEEVEVLVDEELLVVLLDVDE